MNISNHYWRKARNKTPKPNPLPVLRPGDVLLYFDWTSPIDWFIAMRTWCWSAAHVEIYSGNGMSLASRNGLGVNRYGFRRKGLTHVLRPAGFNLAEAEKFFLNVRGTPYGWLDLLRFFSIRISTKGLICSQFGDLLLRSGGVTAFSRNYSAGAVSPRDFLVSPVFAEEWSP